MKLEPYTFDRNRVSFELRFEREEQYKWCVLIFRESIDTSGRISLISGPADDTGAEMEPEKIRDGLITAGRYASDQVPSPDNVRH